MREWMRGARLGELTGAIFEMGALREVTEGAVEVADG